MKIITECRLAAAFAIVLGVVNASETSITVDVGVKDPAGVPVAGANVLLVLPRYRLGEPTAQTEALSNLDGHCRIKGSARQEYFILIKKEGYYPTQTERYAIDTETCMRLYGRGGVTVNLQLKPIRNPIIGISRDVDRLRVPVVNGPIAFDLQRGDWVAPYGKGEKPDFLFQYSGTYISRREYQQDFRLTFANPNDGIVLFKCPKFAGSKFKFPYEAPDSFEAERVWHLGWHPVDGSRGTTIDGSGETNYIFRVRSETDDKGRVTKALYGVVMNDFFPTASDKESGGEISFTYALNPDGTRNIEFDPARVRGSPH